MWVCLCKGVNDRQIRAAINEGARTLEEISISCRAASGCGGCLPEVCRLLADHLAAEAYFTDTRSDRVPVGVASA